MAGFDQRSVIDPTFGGGDGIAEVPGFASDTVSDVTFLYDGGVLVLNPLRRAATGASAGYRLTRLRADGSIDTSYGNGGTVEAARGDGVWPRELTQHEDAWLVASHQTVAGRRRAVLGRHRADGTPDTRFGDDGALTVPLGAGYDATSVATYSDQIFVYGTFAAWKGAPTDPFVARVAQDLRPPRPTPAARNLYADDGRTAVLAVERASALAVSLPPDGRAVVAGERESDGYLAVVGPDRTVETSMTYDFGQRVIFSDVAVDGQGRYVVAGFR